MHCCFTVLNGKVMRKVGVEVVGLGALKLTGFLREKMQQNNLYFESLYTVRTLKEVLLLSLVLKHLLDENLLIFDATNTLGRTYVDPYTSYEF
jgi:hypothetical protein